MPGGTETKAFARLRTRWSWFSPIDTRGYPGVDLLALYHAVDERIPLEVFRWGLDGHARAVER